MALIETMSGPLTKALAQNSQSNLYGSFGMTSTEPSGDGVFSIGDGGILASNRIAIWPYCEGLENNKFSMRLHGWTLYRAQQDTMGIWIPSLIVELSFVSCAKQGPAPPTPTTGMGKSISTMERMCDTISLVHGNVGSTGYINSPGANIISMALVELCGANKIQFDFQFIDSVPMNALWARR